MKILSVISYVCDSLLFIVGEEYISRVSQRGNINLLMQEQPCNVLTVVRSYHIKDTLVQRHGVKCKRYEVYLKINY